MCNLQIGSQAPASSTDTHSYAFTIARGTTSSLSTSYINLASGLALSSSDVVNVAGSTARPTSLTTNFIAGTSTTSTSISMNYIDTPGATGNFYYAVRGISSETTSTVTQFKFYALNVNP